MERAIVLPFSIDDTGSILSSDDPGKIWQSRVIAAVMTELGERVFRPDFGGIVKASLFENSGDAANIVADSVTNVFGHYLKALKLNNVTAGMDTQEGTLSVTIYYTLPSGEKSQASLRTAVINRSGDIIQEY